MSLSTIVHQSNTTRDQFKYMDNDDSESVLDNRIKNLKLKVPQSGNFDEPIRSASEVPFQYGSFDTTRGFGSDKTNVQYARVSESQPMQAPRGNPQSNGASKKKKKKVEKVKTLTNDEIAAQSPSSLTHFIDESCFKPNPLSPLNDINIEEIKRKNEEEDKKPTIKPIDKPFAKQEIRSQRAGGPTDGATDYLYPKAKPEPAPPRPTKSAKELLMEKKLLEQKQKEDEIAAEKRRKEEEEAKKRQEEEERLNELKRKRDAEERQKIAEEREEREREERVRRKKEKKEKKRTERARKKEEEKAQKLEEKKRKLSAEEDEEREHKKSKTTKEATASTRSKIQPVQPARKREEKISPIEKKESPNQKPKQSPNGAPMTQLEMRKVFDDTTKLARHIKHDADALVSTNQITKAFTKYLRSTKMFYDAAIMADEVGDLERSHSIWSTTGPFLISLLRFQKKIPHERERLGMIHVCIMLAAWKSSSFKAQRALTIHVDAPPSLYAADMLNETKERGRKAKSLTDRLSTSNSPSVPAVDSPATSTTMVSPGVPPTNNGTANQPSNLLNVGTAPSELQKDERYFRKVQPLIETSLNFEMFFYSMACAEQFLPQHMKPIPCMSQQDNNFLSFMTKGVDPALVNSYVDEWVTKFEYEDETR